MHLIVDKKSKTSQELNLGVVNEICISRFLILSLRESNVNIVDVCKMKKGVSFES